MRQGSELGWNGARQHVLGHVQSNQGGEIAQRGGEGAFNEVGGDVELLMKASRDQSDAMITSHQPPIIIHTEEKSSKSTPWDHNDTETQCCMACAAPSAW